MSYIDFIQYNYLLQQSNMGLNQLFNERMGFGSYQIQVSLIFCLVSISNGVELVLSSFLNPIIKAVFPQITSGFIELLTSIFYIGMMIGSLMSGDLAEKYGPKKLIAYGAVLKISTSLFFNYTTTLEIMLLLLFCYGFSFGLAMTVTTSMFPEISPQRYTGKGLLLLNFFVSLGKLFAVMLGHFFLEQQLVATNWKLMMVCGALPNVFVLLGCYYILEESPRYLLMHQQISKGLLVIEKMFQWNEKQPMTLTEKKEIRMEFEKKDTDKIADNHFLKVVLHKDNLRKMVALMLCWIIINFCFFGQMVIQAFHLSSKSSSLNLSKYLWTVLGQVPCLPINLYLIDRPGFGRRMSLIIFFIGASLSHLALATTSFVFLSFFAQLFMKNIFQFLNPLTIESFDASVRLKGFGVCSGIGRLGSIFMPFVVIPLDAWSSESVYVLFALLSLVAAAAGYGMLEETMQKQLNSKGKQNKEEFKEIVTNKQKQS